MRAKRGRVDAEIVRLIQDGELPTGTPVLQEGSTDWEPARNHACFQVEIYPKKKRPPVLAETEPAEEKSEDSEEEDPDTIHVARKGEPIGPYSRDKAKEYFAAGQLLPTDWGWHDGMDEWKPLYEVLDMEVPNPNTADPDDKPPILT